MKKVFLTALAALLLSSAGMRRSAQGQTSSTTLSGSWIGTVTLPPRINPSGDTSTILLTYNPNGTVTIVSPINRGGDEVPILVDSRTCPAPRELARREASSSSGKEARGF